MEIVGMLLRLLALGALLLWSIVTSYYLWFQPEQSMERLVEAYSKKPRGILDNREFAIWMFKSGIGIWILRLGFLGMGIMVTNGIILSLRY